MELLGWSIQAPTKLTITVADGHKAVPIGRIFDVPVKFGAVIIVMNMVVVDTTSYDAVLGTDFLTKSKAVIDFDAEKMRIKSKGRRFEIPINIKKGIRPAMVQSDESDQEVYVNQTSMPMNEEKNLLPAIRYLTLEEQNEMTTFLRLRGSCMFCNVENTRCPCPKETLIEQNQDMWDYLLEKCQEEDQVYKALAIQIANEEKTELLLETIQEPQEEATEETDNQWSLTQKEQELYESTDEPDSDDEERPKEGYRFLTIKERRELMDWNMQQQWCPFCEQRIYCAEEMCTCSSTKRIPNQDMLSQHLPERKPRRVAKTNHWGRKERQQCPELAEELYSGRNPHPFANSTGELWDTFWENYPYIGKSHFRKNRWEYSNCYWDEINTTDLWTVTKRSKFDDELFNKDYHLTWKEAHDQDPYNHQVNVIKEERQPDVKVLIKQKIAEIPLKKTEGAAGYDLKVLKKTTILPGVPMIIPTGLAFGIPKGYYGQIKPRSSLALAGLTTDGGVIDTDYTGEVMVILINRNKSLPITIEEGDRYAQILFIPIWTGELKQVTELPKTDRGAQGFRSTGVNATILKKEITETTHSQEKLDKHDYKIGEQLTTNQKKIIKKLMRKYEDVLVTDFEEIRGAHPHFYHDIVLEKGTKPIKLRAYKTPYAYHQWMRKEIARMEAAGIIRPANSPWAFPVVISPKKGTKPGIFAPRFCTDYRELNDVTVNDTYPLPRVDEILAQLGNRPGYLSSLDLFAGFNQIGMTPRATQYSTFITPDGTWQYLRMPFGLNNAPATFQRTMNGIFHDMVGKSMLVYIDDTTIYTRTFEEHIEILEEVLKRLRKNGLFLKPTKCHLASHELAFLGFTVDKNGIHTSKEKVEAVLNYPTPTSKTEIRAFMGLAGYYRQFVQDFSVIAEPINRLLRKSQPFEWGDEQELAFQKLIQKLCSDPILIRPDWNKEFKLYTDASALGLGAILTQDDDDKQERVICYASRGTSDTERNYGATQLECLAVVWAVNYFRYYLLGRRFKVITDHVALKWLFKMKDPSGMFARWIMKLQAYDMEVIYRKGRKHQNADAMSRIPRNGEQIVSVIIYGRWGNLRQ